MSNFDNDESNLNEQTTETTGVNTASEAPAPSLGQRVVKEIVSWILCIAVALGIALVLRTYIFTVVKVDGHSMDPTLADGQRLFTRIIGYEPDRGDIIIFHPKSDPQVAYVKRVIATEGDRIWIDDMTGEVHLKKAGSDEWTILKEDYIMQEPYNGRIPNIAQKFASGDGEGLLIEEDHIFVMGDNRNNSNDSRNGMVGQVSLDSVIGHANFRWWPFSDMGVLK